LAPIICNSIGYAVENILDSFVSGSSAMETEVKIPYWSNIKAAAKCFSGGGSKLLNFGEACGGILTAVKKVFSTYPDVDTGEEGGGNGSNEPKSPNCRPKLKHAGSWFDFLVALVLKLEECGGCLKDAFDGSGSGGGSGKKKCTGKKCAKNINFTPLKILTQVLELWCCLGECNCVYFETTCDLDDPKRKACSEMTKCEYIKDCTTYRNSKDDCENGNEAGCARVRSMNAQIGYKKGDCMHDRNGHDGPVAQPFDNGHDGPVVSWDFEPQGFTENGYRTG
jgi:hypothetical protein